MRIIIYGLLLVVAMIAHLVLVPFAEVPCALLIAILFFDGRTPALISAVLLGFFLDVFSPVFGLHLVLYPLVVLIASQLSTALLTDQSLLSFAVLSFAAYLALRILSSIAYLSVSLITHLPVILPFPYFLQTFLIGLVSQGVILLLLYGIGRELSRRMSSSYSFSRSF